MTKTFEALVAFVAVPWAFFVATFLYTVGFTLVVISGVDMPATVVVAGYGLPVAIYTLVLAARLLHGFTAAVAHLAPNKASPMALAR
jgi:hypothetical protein